MMRRTINLLLMLLFVAEVTFANTVDFDKAFKESARIEKQRIFQGLNSTIPVLRHRPHRRIN